MLVSWFAVTRVPAAESLGQPRRTATLAAEAVVTVGASCQYHRDRDEFKLLNMTTGAASDVRQWQYGTQTYH